MKLTKTPIYVQCENAEINDRMQEIEHLLQEVENKAAFLHFKGPMLYAVPAPDNDCMSIGNIVVYGISSLDEEQSKALSALLESFIK